MEQALDSLGAYRKLEESGMPEPQAGATVEVVKDAMQNLVTKQFFVTELDRRFGAVDGKFTSVDQQFKAIDNRFAIVDERFEAVDKRFEAVDKRFDTVDKRFDAVDKRFDAVDKRFDAIDHRLDTMDERFTDMDQKFTELKIDMRQDFADLRVDVANSHKFLIATMLATALAVIGVQLAMLLLFLRPLIGQSMQELELEAPPALHQPLEAQ